MLTQQLLAFIQQPKLFRGHIIAKVRVLQQIHHRPRFFPFHKYYTYQNQTDIENVLNNSKTIQKQRENQIILLISLINDYHGNGDHIISNHLYIKLEVIPKSKTLF